MGGTYIYIDALNFYYGAVKRTNNKWVDLEALAQHLVPQDQVTMIRYFTANVKQRWPGDRAHERQNVYLRAIKTNPIIRVTHGHFRADYKWRPLADTKFEIGELFRPTLRPAWLARLMFEDAKRRRSSPATVARVKIPEEKGSDVNLATYLLHDALTKKSDKAIVISNDADLAEAVRLTVASGVPVGIVNPHQGPVNGHLKRAGSFVMPFRREDLGSLQMPATVTDSKGRQIHRPKEW
jgi:uncharacterized LabA/DUF88 family protein